LRSGMIDMESNTTLVQCYPAHEAIPDGQGPFPAVIVAHDRFGLSPHIRGVANRLANAGFYALAPSLYATPTSVADVAPEFMRPSRAVHYGYDDEERAQDAAAMLSQERAEAILAQALGFAISRGKVRAPAGVGILGFSMGARLAFLAACRNPEEVRACVAFYGKGIAGSPALPHGRPGGSGDRKVPRLDRWSESNLAPLEMAGNLRASVLLFYGGLDTTVSRRERDAIRERLSALGKDFRMEVFHDAGEDFFLEERDSYRIHASKVAWEETLALFHRCL
jgi:carboxymethylenebutenolidase